MSHLREEKLSSTAQFLRDSVILRDSVGTFGCLCILSRDELNYIVHSLLRIFSFLLFFLFLYFVYSVIINK